MASETIDLFFLKIDRIQFEVFDKIDEVLNLNKTPSQTQSIEERRSTLSKSANAQITKIPGLLDVLSVQIKQVTNAELSSQHYNEKFLLYKEKVNYLKLKLRESQLIASSMEHELIHKQRIQEYVKEESLQPEDLRAELFAGRSQESTENNEKSIDEQVLTQNQNITSSLKLTKQLMTMSVMQTELNIDNLVQQSRDLNKLNDKLVDLESVLLKSRQIVKFIEKQDKHDKRRIYASIGFLLLCSAWVLWRRVFKLPVKILLWSLLKFFGVFNWVVSKYPSPLGKEISGFETYGEPESISVFPTPEPIAEYKEPEEQQSSILPIDTEVPIGETETALTDESDQQEEERMNRETVEEPDEEKNSQEYEQEQVIADQQVIHKAVDEVEEIVQDNTFEPELETDDFESGMISEDVIEEKYVELPEENEDEAEPVQIEVEQENLDQREVTETEDAIELDTSSQFEEVALSIGEYPESAHTENFSPPEQDSFNDSIEEPQEVSLEESKNEDLEHIQDESPHDEHIYEAQEPSKQEESDIVIEGRDVSTEIPMQEEHMEVETGESAEIFADSYIEEEQSSEEYPIEDKLEDVNVEETDEASPLENSKDLPQLSFPDTEEIIQSIDTEQHQVWEPTHEHIVDEL